MRAPSGPTIIRIEFGGEVPPRTFLPVVTDLQLPSVLVDPLTLPVLADARPSIGDQATEWADRLAGTLEGPSMVLGYCAAAGLAVLLSDRLVERRCQVTAAVIVEPSRPDKDEIQRTLDDILAPINELVVGDSALPRLEAYSLHREFDVLLDTLRAALGDDSPHVTHDLARRYLSWINFLISAEGHDFPSTAAAAAVPVHVVAAAEPPPEGGHRPRWTEFHPIESTTGAVMGTPAADRVVSRIVAQLSS